MGRALIAVGAFLGVCFAVFGGVVYFTRDEDTIAVDSILAERITRAVAEAERRGEDVDLRELTDFEWDRVLIYEVDTPRAQVSEVLGFEFMGDLPYTAESSDVFVFTRRGRFVRFADYRGRGRFELPDRPIDVLRAGEAVFEVRDLVARPR